MSTPTGLAYNTVQPIYGFDSLGNWGVKKNIYGLDNTFKTVDVGNDNQANITANVSAIDSIPKTNETTDWTSAIKDWFTPGTNGASVGGNVLKGAGDVIGGLSGLAGMYYTKKNFDLQKKQQDIDNSIQDKQLAKQDQMQSNYDATV